ncbi:succinate dehydrogenase iron-sulfur subunit [Caldinitratiruptor microaerophilus]|uniref:succinate dehydrogenase n=1 Tax=Caldinitratiruptor microaerophilus TaxID=671077 RepID=A0AA35G9E0_9FIRM|nr:succinate dehydrogenase iron-sulfur subunit [Caldinitratiruptor microaerophilus]BDG62075.1 succinate dehydrogenase iron-sulfur subunit [Caldinitratiruptor microaerophilus]
MATNGSTVRLKIKRQDGPDKESYWEEFEVPYSPGMNVISALMEIQKNPVNARGEKTTPVVWESNCLEEVCGACTMVINGKTRQACSALIDKLPQPISLEPMRAFPVKRDLMVDRSRMFETLKKIRAWIDIDGTYDLGPGPRYSPAEQEWRYELSKCMTCGVCLDVCPNYGPQSEFMGPFAFGQVALFNSHPSGKLHADERLAAFMGPDGLTGCGNAQNCVKACPKGIPLTEAIAEINRQATLFSLRRFFRGR